MQTTYQVKPGRDQLVRFVARTQVESYAGRTDQVAGEVRCDPDQPTKSASARFEVKMGSLTTGNGSRDSNMRRNFLEVDRYPTATFLMTRLDASPGALPFDKAVPGTVYGTFNLHGVTRDVIAKGSVTREKVAGRESLHIIANFLVRLGDYKIGTPHFLFLVVKQDHPITIDVRAVAAP